MIRPATGASRRAAEGDGALARQVPESSRAGAQIGSGARHGRPGRRHLPDPVSQRERRSPGPPPRGPRTRLRYGGDHLHLDGPGHYAIAGEPGWQPAADHIIAWLDHHAQDTPTDQDRRVTQP